MEENYTFTASAKKNLIITLIVGVVLTIIGAVALSLGDGGHEAGHAETAKTETAHGDTHEQSSSHGKDHDSEHSEAGHGGDQGHSYSWTTRFFANLWINNVYFVGLSIIGVFFVAIQYVSQAGWSAGIKRIPEAFGYWLPIGGILMLLLFVVSSHDLFHWTHVDLYDESSAHYDEIIDGKKGFFFWPLHESPSIPVFFYFRLIVFFLLWYWFFTKIRKLSIQEDLEGGNSKWYSMRTNSAIFIIIFAVSSSIAAWDWVMSIDTHWFSTMFGWYVFASWWVAGLSLITFLVVMLKDKGYLSIVNENHLHDLGKFIFAFSIFWTYIWFSQFLLIYYANIPEETIYFVQRWKNPHFAPIFYLNIIINFFFPFLVLMTRDSKRHTRFLKIVCPTLLFGHWLDFYLMVTPGTVGNNSNIGLLEIGLAIIFLSAFLYIVHMNLAKVPLVAKNHPMLKESLHHHI